MDAIEILEKVNEFYTNAFGNLLTLTLAIIGFGGFLLPLILQYFQKITLKNEREALETKIDEYFKKAKLDLGQEVSALFEIEEKKLKEEITKDIAEAKGIGFLLQAHNSAQDGEFEQAAIDYINASMNALNAMDEFNARQILNQLIEKVLPKINKESFEEFFRLKDRLQYLLEILEELNENRRFTGEIREIKSQLKRIEREQVENKEE